VINIWNVYEPVYSQHKGVNDGIEVTKAKPRSSLELGRKRVSYSGIDHHYKPVADIIPNSQSGYVFGDSSNGKT
jgi:hypothetical protein